MVALPGGKKRALTSQVWNATVANLSLMALGSSAPEILLSVIEIAGASFYAGELGPSTIVGSAAFNLMVISAVCVSALPGSEGRYIKQRSVFYITSFFSVLAYIWLLVILTYFSPNVVEVWEGFVTLALFPILVYIAYLADIGAISCSLGGSGTSAALVGNRSTRKVILTGGGGAARSAVHSPAYYLRKAVGTATGTGAQEARDNRRLNKIEAAAAQAEKTGRSARFAMATATSKARLQQTVEKTDATIELGATRFAAREADGYVEVQVFRSGSLAAIASVGFQITLDVAASTVEAEGRLTFEPTQQTATLKVEVLPEDQRQNAGAEGAAFWVHLHDASRGATLGSTTRCAVAVVVGNAPGVVCLESDSLRVKEDASAAVFTLRREEGYHGVISVEVNTRDGTAIAPSDYAKVEGHVVTFDHGEVVKTVEVEIHNDDQFEGDEEFNVIFSNATGGATFSMDCNGGPERAVASVVIECDDEAEQAGCGGLLVAIGINADLWTRVGFEWRTQLEEAVAFDGDCTVGAFIFYLLAIPWRFVFALAPPPRLMGGWGCFVVALAMIGGLTAIIGDLANNLGCCLGISQSVTAITFVALGTSLPDTFASKSAATSEPHADASLGNITGSNSVNVFLGLGLPWFFAAIYWSYAASPASQEAWHRRYAPEAWYSPSMPVAFAVPASDLSFSVLVFSACALTTLGIIFLRRAVFGYELGGPPFWARLTSLVFVLLWFVYIALSIWYIESSA